MLFWCLSCFLSLFGLFCLVELSGVGCLLIVFLVGYCWVDCAFVLFCIPVECLYFGVCCLIRYIDLFLDVIVYVL